MKKIIVFAVIIAFFSQCSEPAKTTEENQDVKTTHEELKMYQISSLDSVYSVDVKLTSTKFVVAQYNVLLTRGAEMHSDSIVFTIPANEEVAGEIIFPNCSYSEKSKPTFTSKIKIIERK